ncbi:MAG: hypothetical protein HWD92_02465 [Flavobacteriia bacterium]|nr:hypothetical protein [Flavobacteriia bacterium]
MAFDSIGENILFAVLFGLVIILLNLSALRKATVVEGVKTLRVPKIVHYGGALFMIGGSIEMVRAMAQDDEDSLMVVLFFFPFLFIGYLLIRFRSTFKVEFDEESFTVTNTFKRNKTLKWSEIEEVKFSLSANAHKLRARDTTASISMNLVGVNEFLKMMESQTRFKRQDKKMKW